MNIEYILTIKKRFWFEFNSFQWEESIKFQLSGGKGLTNH